MSVCCECCVLSNRGLCDELITRPEESYRLWCVVVCDLDITKILVNEEKAKTHKGAIAPRENKNYTGCPRRNVRDFGRVFLVLNYTDITQNTYIQSWTVTEIMAIEKCGLLGRPRTVRRP